MSAAAVLQVTRYPRCWDIAVRCPHCGRTHHHGGGDGAVPFLGARVAHCAAGGSYRLAVTPDTQVGDE